MNRTSDTRSGERERPDPAFKGHLPRLSPENYRGLAFVHWTLTVENRATGWLTDGFHHRWQLTLLHACARYSLACPAYVLMDDHAHLILLGTDRHGSDQRVAMEFIRRQLAAAIKPAEWQKQAYDNVLREAERAHGAFSAVAHYVFENPVRRNLVQEWQDYPYLGMCLPGYPDMDPRRDDYWELFWRIYARLCGAPGVGSLTLPATLGDRTSRT